MFDYEPDLDDYEYLQELDDEPPLTYYDSPNHNPPGILAVGMKLLGRCPCVCHCAYCISGIDLDQEKHTRYRY